MLRRSRACLGARHATQVHLEAGELHAQGQHFFAKKDRSPLLHSTTPVVQVTLVPQCGARGCATDRMNATAKIAKSNYLQSGSENMS